jgi:hypothetical protein
MTSDKMAFSFRMLTGFFKHLTEVDNHATRFTRSVIRTLAMLTGSARDS